MKNLLITIALLLSSLTYSQVSYSAYVPLRTYHFNREYSSMKNYSGSEGGNIGLILGRRYNYKSIYLENQVGVIRNSYGVASVIIAQGIGTKVSVLDIGIIVGFASGYQLAYKEVDILENYDNVFSRNGVLPIAAVNISLHKGMKLNRIDITPLIVVSPTYLNGGLRFTLKNP